MDNIAIDFELRIAVSKVDVINGFEEIFEKVPDAVDYTGKPVSAFRKVTRSTSNVFIMLGITTYNFRELHDEFIKSQKDLHWKVMRFAFEYPKGDGPHVITISGTAYTHDQLDNMLHFAEEFFCRKAGKIPGGGEY